MTLVGTDWDTLFCSADDFCQAFIPAMHAQVLADGARRRDRKTAMSESEADSTPKRNTG